MGFRCGIVGLPNVGKSTLFNALTGTANALAANYPFSTIEPNLGRVPVPDQRLDTLAKLAKSKQIVPTFLDFVDIAGLVKGASKGEGLGNQFLAHIREIDAVLHVLRCFEDGNVIHVSGGPNPVADAEVVETELLLADLEGLERRMDRLGKEAKGADREAKARFAVAERVLAALRDGKPSSSVAVSDEERPFRDELQLLSGKPTLYVLNVDEAGLRDGNALTAKAEAWIAQSGAPSVRVCATIESEIATLESAEDRAAFLADLGLEEPGLNRIIRAGYGLLGLLTFLTAGPMESRAWTVRAGASAVEAAATIHTDIAHGFIRAETIAYDDYVKHGGEQGAREAGRMRLEGRDYIVQDGDVLHFRHNS